jgi:hypothetical protein
VRILKERPTQLILPILRGFRTNLAVCQVSQDMCRDAIERGTEFRRSSRKGCAGIMARFTSTNSILGLLFLKQLAILPRSQQFADIFTGDFEVPDFPVAILNSVSFDYHLINIVLEVVLL